MGNSRYCSGIRNTVEGMCLLKLQMTKHGNSTYFMCDICTCYVATKLGEGCESICYMDKQFGKCRDSQGQKFEIKCDQLF